MDVATAEDSDNRLFRRRWLDRVVRKISSFRHRFDRAISWRWRTDLQQNEIALSGLALGFTDRLGLETLLCEMSSAMLVSAPRTAG
jgi:hypothetical protein